MTDTAARPLPGHMRPPPRKSLSGWLPWPWLFPLLAFAVTWILILITWRVAALISHTSMPWVTYFTFKDAGFYFKIIEHGYVAWPGHLPPGVPPPQVAFFPLLPGLVKAVSYLTFFTGASRYLWAGLVVQVLAGALSCLAIWMLAARITNHRVADRSVIIYCAFPGAMTLGMLYTEPLGIALCAFCLLAAVNRKWVTAGLLGFLATTEHSTWLILAPVLAVVALREIWLRRDWRSLIAPALTPCGMLAYFAWLAPRFHDFFFWFWAEKKYWGSGVDFGVHEMSLVFWTYAPATRYTIFNTLVTFIFVVAVVGCWLVYTARLPLPVSLYTIGLLIYLVISKSADKPRFIWGAFGIFIAAAAKLPRWAFWPVTAVFAGLLAFCVGWWPQHPFGPAP